jgi:hypothetical protein
MPIPEKLPEQLLLALQVGFGLKGYDRQISTEEMRLLGIESAVPMPDDVKRAAMEIIYETLIFLLSGHVEEQVVDLRQVAVELLKKIEENGGSLRKDQIGLPEELIGQYETEGIVRRTVHGLIRGPRAKQAIRIVEEEKRGK